MEKYSQYRDRGSGISPFLPVTTPASVPARLIGLWLLAFRLPLFVVYGAVYFLLLDHLPLPPFLRKLQLWTLLAIPGIWWIDLQLDGVKRGSLYQQPPSRFPRERAVIAAQFTSPIDAIYLAAIFDPIFVVSYPETRKVQQVSLFRAVVLALAPPSLVVPRTGLTTISAILEQNPRRIVAVFPEMTTTNGKAILPFSPSLLSSPADVSIFPVSLRYTPPDITTPVPGAWWSFLWNLLSKPTHYIRVRVAEGVTNTSAATNGLGHRDMTAEALVAAREDKDHLTPEEQRIMYRIGETLARLARNKLVGLTVVDKISFVEAWSRGQK
ncbi:hypothetical protein F5X97DRAFT_147334 [Nemania serpens]|nr:hypothetical protein F5X97DRAFT_147334 [Nemania serpens]